MMKFLISICLLSIVNCEKSYKSNNETLNATSIDSNKRSMMAELSKIGRDRSSIIINNNNNNNNNKFVRTQIENNKNISEWSNKLKPNGKNNPKRGISQIKSIYNSLRDGNLIFGDNRINTIRYVPSVKVETNKKIHFLFNLSQLKSSEILIKPELYINKRYIKHKLTFNLHYLMYTSTFNKPITSNSSKQSSFKDIKNTLFNQNSIATIIDLANIKSDRRNGWQMFNLFDSLNSYLNVRNSKQEMLKLKSKINKNSKSSIYYTLNDNLSLNEKSNDTEELVLIMEAYSNNNKILFNDAINPYLIIYTSEEDTNMKKFFQDRLPTELQQSEEEEEEEEQSVELADSAELNKLKEFEDQVDKMNENVSSWSEPEINDNDNKIENSSSNQEDLTNLLSNDLSYYKDFKNKKSSRFNYLPKIGGETSFIIDRAEDKNKFQEIKFYLSGKEQANKKSKRQLIRLDDSKCDTQSILIDFDDLSFSNWILEPKSFESNYCSGGCKLPLNKKITYSNYATLQSILHSINMDDFRTSNNPPSLCCAPSLTKPLPILYIDTNLNDHVVKILPDMIVKECACL